MTNNQYKNYSKMESCTSNTMPNICNKYYDPSCDDFCGDSCDSKDCYRNTNCEHCSNDMDSNPCPEPWNVGCSDNCNPCPKSSCNTQCCNNCSESSCNANYNYSATSYSPSNMPYNFNANNTQNYYPNNNFNNMYGPYKNSNMSDMKSNF